jgi:hypothetical protein
MEGESTKQGHTSAREMITREVKAGHCACEVRNPKGACCLGDVVRIESALRRGVSSREE